MTPSPDQLRQIVLEHHGITEMELRAGGRRKHIVPARYDLVTALRRFTRMSMPEAARYMGWRSHGAIPRITRQRRNITYIIDAVEKWRAEHAAQAPLREAAAMVGLHGKLMEFMQRENITAKQLTEYLRHRLTTTTQTSTITNERNTHHATKEKPGNSVHSHHHAAASAHRADDEAARSKACSSRDGDIARSVQPTARRRSCGSDRTAAMTA